MRPIWILLGGAALIAPATADLSGQRQPPGAGASCPWCGGEPARMEAAGVLSHGPLPVGPADADAFLALLSDTEWIFLETAHLRWISSLPELRLSARDRQRLEPELERLRQRIPELPRRINRLDPWLRVHLMAQRGEEFYARFQALLGVRDEDFTRLRMPEDPYMGAGLYLGETDKFEVVLHARRDTHELYTERFMGVRVTDALRWHVNEAHKLVVSIPAEDSDLRDDRWLWPHVVHNLAHMFFGAYKHYSFDPPVWLDEGLAHAMEREIEPESWTREGEEGVYEERSRGSDWNDRVVQLVRRNRAASLTVLLHKSTIGELSEEEHVTAWSMVRFLLDLYPEDMAALLGAVKGQLDENGLPTGKDLESVQRRLLLERRGWTPADFDEAWRTWILRKR